MEIKLRRKGEVVTVDGFPEHSIPKAITPTEGLEGIDLTAYSVIYAGFGRHGGDKARELHSRAPGAIVVYKYEWRNGWGEGVLLPEPFNPSRVRFYKSAAQAKAEAEETKKKAAKSLRDEVSQAIPGVRVIVGYYSHDGGVEVSPEQETFSDDWRIYAKSLEEAKEGVEKMRPIWQEWNERALNVYARRGLENPGNGNIKVVFRGHNPPHECESVHIHFVGKVDSRGSYDQGWIVLRKTIRGWEEDQ